MLTETTRQDETVAPTAAVVQIFGNPLAGGYSPARVRALAEAFEARGARVILSEAATGTPQIVPEATHLCVAGGDGTVRHVAAAAMLADRPVTLSIYPTGTVNLLAREAGYAADPAVFAGMVLGGKRKLPHYPVSFGGGHFLACASVGPDSLAVDAVSLPLKRRIGRFAYVVSLLNLLWHWPRHRIVLLADDREVACEAFYVAKCRYYAGRWSFAPGACVGDPALHVVALTKARRRDYLRFVLGLALGLRAESQKGVMVFTCRKLVVEADQPLPLQADGDIVGHVPGVLEVSEQPLPFC